VEFATVLTERERRTTERRLKNENFVAEKMFRLQMIRLLLKNSFVFRREEFENLHSTIEKRSEKRKFKDKNCAKSQSQSEEFE
jgi:hypothetical protein